MDEQYYITILVSRELTDVEFEELTEIIDDEIGDIVASDEVYEYENTDRMMCYEFKLLAPVEMCEQGKAALDLISYELDQLIPSGLEWSIELE